MIKHNESGTEDKISVEGDLADLKAGSGISVDNNTTYEYGADLHTEGAPIIDPAEGRTISIRLFEFKMNPGLKIRHLDKQQVFNSHASQIKTILWGDGLRPLDEVGPRVILNKKKGTYQIFVPCEARRDVLFIEKPRSLSEQLTKQNGSTRH